jgi:magnesium transporter
MDQLRPEALWIDLIKPSDEERRWVKEVYGQDLPSMELLVEIEASSRFFEDEQGLHLRSYFLHEFPDRPRNVTVGFIFTSGHLFTLRKEELPAFDHLLRQAGQRPGIARDAHSIALGLFETQIDCIADILERLYGELDRYSNGVFGSDTRDMEHVVTHMTGVDDVNSKARLSLMDKQVGNVIINGN